MAIYNTNAYRLLIDDASLPADGEIFVETDTGDIYEHLGDGEWKQIGKNGARFVSSQIENITSAQKTALESSLGTGDANTYYHVTDLGIGVPADFRWDGQQFVLDQQTFNGRCVCLRDGEEGRSCECH